MLECCLALPALLGLIALGPYIMFNVCRVTWAEQAAADGTPGTHSLPPPLQPTASREGLGLSEGSELSSPFAGVQSKVSQIRHSVLIAPG